MDTVAIVLIISDGGGGTARLGSLPRANSLSGAELGCLSPNGTVLTTVVQGFSSQ